ncbi:hypothetical protein [Leptospira idonii]|uniref:Lipoprotein n=1 Tax=Leptospira idonii TaxID=1193500 RepID=A0A4R9LZT7_9LEPT|nr:hypothetical protein [Leptospira idonii]TGN19161.1 hypothetical protein EHS15_10400 [Leptospira idonii]
MKKILLTCLLAGFFQLNCFLHHANVSGDFYGAKNLVSLNFGDKARSLPIKIEFDTREKNFIFEKLRKKGQNIKVDPNLVEGYYSEEIISNFRSSKLFNHNPDANIKVRIYSTIEEVRDPVLTRIPNIITLGLFPAITRTYGRVEFELFDDKTNTILKSFKYPIHHRMFLTAGAFVLGPILPMFSNRFDHSQNERTYAIMRVAFQQFEIDLHDTLQNNEALLAKFTVEKPSVFAFLPFQPEKPPETEVYPILYSELEAAFVARGLKLVERKELHKVFEEITFSQTGLTENSRNKIGTMLNADRVIIVSDLKYVPAQNARPMELGFSVRCVDVKTGRIIWTEPSKYQSYEKLPLHSHVNSAIFPFISELRMRGEI